jgi:hypothetical protein
MASHLSKAEWTSNSRPPPAFRFVLTVLSAAVLVELIWVLALVGQHTPRIGERVLGFFCIDMLIVGICSLVPEQWLRRNWQTGNRSNPVTDEAIDQPVPGAKPKKSPFPWQTAGLINLLLVEVMGITRITLEHGYAMLPRMLLIALLMDLTWIDFVILVMLLFTARPKRRTMRTDN